MTKPAPCEACLWGAAPQCLKEWEDFTFCDTKVKRLIHIVEIPASPFHGYHVYRFFCRGDGFESKFEVLKKRKK